MNETESLRPSSRDEFVGQVRLMKRLTVSVESALDRKVPLDSVLLTGPPGFGKTSLSLLLAGMLFEPIEMVTMPLSDRALGNLVRRHRGIVLLDELHNASKAQQKTLLPLIEDHYVEDNRGRRTYNTWLTVVGATTEPQEIIKPLYDRFMIKPMFQPYSDDELGRIVTSMATKIGIKLHSKVAVALGQAAGGAPRNAKSLVLAARDLKIGSKPSDATKILDFCGVGPDGLSEQHMAYLEALDMLGGTAGLRPLSSTLRLHPSVCMELERLLTEKRYIQPGDRGRELTSEGVHRMRNEPIMEGKR